MYRVDDEHPRVPQYVFRPREPWNPFYPTATVKVNKKTDEDLEKKIRELIIIDWDYLDLLECSMDERDFMASQMNAIQRLMKRTAVFYRHDLDWRTSPSFCRIWEKYLMLYAYYNLLQREGRYQPADPSKPDFERIETYPSENQVNSLFNDLELRTGQIDFDRFWTWMN